MGNQRQKLLEAFYNDALPSDLLKVEQARITSEIEIARRVVETNLDVTIEFAKHCRSMYLQADPRVRPRINQQDTTGAYLLGDAVAAPQPMLWGMRVVLTTTMTENSALVGNFARAAKGWVREGPSFDVAPSSGDEFKTNVTLFRAEERIALEVVRPEALCVITAV